MNHLGVSAGFRAWYGRGLLVELCHLWLRRPAISVSLLALGLAIGLSHSVAHYIDVTSPLNLASIESINISIDTEAGIRTDAGRMVPVAMPERLPTQEELDNARQNDSTVNFVCTDGPGADYNCHGWVFTGGRYWIRGQDVPHILRDNGYEAVTEPAPGDIIIYRQGDDIIHTGLVRTVNAAGILIESKWGVRGRFIHPPAESVYQSDFQYYRSQRRGHLLEGVAEWCETHPDGASAPARAEH